MNLHVTDVPMFTSSSAKALGLKNLQLPDVAEGGGPPNGARIVHYGSISCLYRRTPLLMERQLLLCRRELTRRSLLAVFFLTWTI